MNGPDSPRRPDAHASISAARVSGRAALLAAICAIVAVAAAIASPLPSPATVRRTDPGFHALVHAQLVAGPGEHVEDATIVVRDGVIISVESGGQPPEGARVWDCTGLRVYPGLIESYLPVPMADPSSPGPGKHWNDKVLAHRSAARDAVLSDADLAARRKLGFTHAVVAPNSGAFRGTAALISLAESGDPTNPTSRVLAEDLWHAAALETGAWRSGAYPSSKMGVIALLRQTLADADWWPKAHRAWQNNPASNPRPETSDALVALSKPLKGLLFDVNDDLDALRVAKVAREFSREFMIVGSGTEYRRLPAIVELGVPMIVPLTFPKAPAASTQADRDALTLRELMDWEQAPTNARRLIEAGATVAITASKLGQGESFEANMRRALQHGLQRSDALAALTTTPAKLLGMEDRLGRVAPGYLANMIVVAEGGLFAEGRVIRDVWIEGKRHEINPAPNTRLRGEWQLADEAGRDLGTLIVDERNSVTYRKPAVASTHTTADGAEPDAEPASDSADAPSERGNAERSRDRGQRLRRAVVVENRLDAVLPAGAVPGDQTGTLSASVDGDQLTGTLSPLDGPGIRVVGRRVPSTADAAGSSAGKPDSNEHFQMPPDITAYPLGAFGYPRGWAEQFPAGLILVNATIWTNEDRGIVEIGSVIVNQGKIVNIIPGEVTAQYETMMQDNVYVIDCRGKHITPGLIDAHSHTGISGGVNEGTRSSTAMVRIGDVVDPDDINWYRQLAGGVTAVNQLHGSANSIGGQNSVVKLRWGSLDPERMRIAEAPAGIKFALGENVKQSNWGERATTRYPQTRMGVDTFFRDRFHAAREYAQKIRRYESLPAAERERLAPPRRDLELEALSEILDGSRWIHCHSYRQDEIIQLCRVAAEFGIRIGTFQHVLEGYKAAEVIREHARGVSSFSDWWAYKFEVYDAIPYNGAIMHQVGLNVSFNSDSNEMARRLNTEAAKAVKYGGVSREEALKFVTLNPAIQLGISHRVGSIEPGKDADLVVWSGDPLSAFSRVERVFIDGAEMFSLEHDEDLRYAAEKERARILAKLIDADTGRSPRGDDRNGPGGPGAAFAAATEDLLHGAFVSSLRSGRSFRPNDFGMRPDFASDPEAEAAYESRLLEAYFEWMVTNGLDPFRCGPGDCGCATHSVFQIR